MVGGSASSRSSAAIMTFAIIVALIVIQIVTYAPRLPDEVADNFDFDGTPNGSSGKTPFVVLYAVMVAFTALIFIGISRFLPRIPPSLINMPNKKYWLAPERKEESLAYLSRQMLHAGNATLALIALVFQQIIVVNVNAMEGEPRLGLLLWILMGIYFVYMTVWVVRLFVRFR